MAIPINTDDLVNLRVIESARVEFKANWNPESSLHSICAFANDIQELFALSEVIPFDDRINPKANIEDLRPPLIVNP